MLTKIRRQIHIYGLRNICRLVLFSQGDSLPTKLLFSGFGKQGTITKSLWKSGAFGCNADDSIATVGMAIVSSLWREISNPLTAEAPVHFDL
jgi:hypothetical protein